MSFINSVYMTIPYHLAVECVRLIYHFSDHKSVSHQDYSAKVALDFLKSQYDSLDAVKDE